MLYWQTIARYLFLATKPGSINLLSLVSGNFRRVGKFTRFFIGRANSCFTARGLTICRTPRLHSSASQRRNIRTAFNFTYDVQTARPGGRISPLIIYVLSMKILETHNLKKHFGGVYAVDALNISFEQGKVTGIVGPNGSGKSTLTNLLTGVHKIDGGTVKIDGVRLQKIIPHQNPLFGVTRTYQDVHLFEQMTVGDNILVVLTERNVWGALFSNHAKLDEVKVKEILETVGLWEKRRQLAANLSYGQRKLLEIGRVLAMDAKIIFFDEPFAGLYKEIIKQVVLIIEKMRAAGKTIILIEHNMELIRQLCDYLYVMDEGKLLAEGNPGKVLAEKKVIEAYLGE